ncbi:hypothetical protein PAAG_03592 [Paracoccidioides lutzii Pb01]|uniref:Uncharacterized protein n=1 Tax=Paracoccidioides lutzii (strain ATCC MYA-826 / Pb01) TaxID=502779 RepID=C1GXL8_PARBA|nr:hypothetical protein PAAG_03592 [Paracoccidioides lutzii Pb01]EEH41306.2 hypothetical protein PAAG_03592 [Paracoccidioides lutzii Pb01]
MATFGRGPSSDGTSSDLLEHPHASRVEFSLIKLLYQSIIQQRLSWETMASEARTRPPADMFMDCRGRPPSEKKKGQTLEDSVPRLLKRMCRKKIRN